jgi:Zn-dependent membrane protease YugP
VVAVFALLVGKIPVMGAIAIPVGATAIAALMGILTLPPELAAIHRAARKVREDRNFPSRDDEDAVIRCATAHAWDAALPPILRWLQR